MMNRPQVAVADTAMANAGSTARTTIIPPCYSPLRASLSRHHGQQRGSLPLKKRRFLLDLSSNEGYEYQLQPRWQSSMKTPSSSCSSSSKLDSSPYSPDSTTNNPLLALVAAASVSTEPPSSLYSTPSCVSHPDYSTVTTKPYHYPYSLSAASSSSTTSSCYNLIPEEEQQDAQQPLEEGDSPVHNNSLKRRIHHPPLSSPLPGGCHGRTSRNNSYCRRQPCYNGSQYCKLHYQQYIVVSGKEVDSNRAAVVVVERAQQEQQPLPLQQHAPAKHIHHHQDKRFTGLNSTEQRCQATTTRGRACAYVSVNNTLYCHLHADYDTNPPPRRGGGGSASKNEKVLQQQQQQVLPPPPPVMSASSPASQQRQQPSSVSSPPSVTSESSSSSSSSSVVAESVAASAISTPKTKKKKRVIVNNSPYPLLCSVSSDQWYDKLVLISTGPLKNHTGRVQKWGNGWVTVQTSSEKLLHNRRSVELLLLPNDYNDNGTAKVAVQEESAGEKIGTPTQDDEMKSTAVQVDAGWEKGAAKQEKEVKTGDVETKTIAVQEDAELEEGSSMQEKELKTGDLEKHEPPSLKETTNTAQGGALLRCVSREADVPPPSTAASTPVIVESNSNTTSLDDDTPKEETKVGSPTPPVMVESNSSSSSIPNKGEEVGRPETKEKTATASEEKEEPIVHVPKEEPLLPERQSTPEAQPEKELLQTRATDPTPVKQESFSNQPQLVTPNSPRKVTAHKNGDSGPPLVDCLLAAQEGRRTNTKFNMDLLFGTAALERSRRTVHKPTRYEDTAMLERKRSRMNSGTSESSGDDASSESVKRKRVDA